MSERTLLQQLDDLVTGGDDSLSGEDPLQNHHHSASKPAFENERLLVAWLILLRLPQEQLDEAWKKHDDILTNYAVRLLRIDDEAIDDTPEQKRLFISYVRLMAQVLARLEGVSSDQLVTILQCIVDAWEFVVTKWLRHDDAATMLPLNVDVASCLLIFFAQVQDTRQTVSDILTKMWDAYTIMEDGVIQGNGASAAAEGATEDRDSQQMSQVLETWLTGKQENNDEYTVDMWHQLLMNIFTTQQDQITAQLASRMLFWIANKEKDKGFPSELQCSWHQWLMRLVGRNADGSHTKSKKLLLQDPKAMDAMQKILFAHAVSPDKGALRADAWQAVAQIAQQYGWKWNKTYSTNAPICTWTRLASGEWKIQLEKGQNIADEDRSILDGCGKVMINVVEFLLRTEDRPDQSISLDASAMMHIKESLDEAFSVTSEYISAYSDDEMVPMVREMWCQLLPELDLQMLQNLDTAISAFQRLLQSSNDADVVMMRPLVHVLGSMEDTRTRLYSMMLPLEAPIVSHLERFWKKLSQHICLRTDEDISWACCATDLALEVFSSDENHQRISTAMVSFLRRCIVTFGNLKPHEMSNALQNLQLVLESFRQARVAASNEQEMEVIATASAFCGLEG